jgi:hypothetical protein
MAVITRDDLKAARRAYDEAIAKAERQRAAILAKASAEGMPQKEIIEATEYSRETVRRIIAAGKEQA